MSTLTGLLTSEIHLHVYSLLVLLCTSFLLGPLFLVLQSNANHSISKRILALMLASIALMALSFVLRRELGPAADWSYLLTSVQMAYGPLFYFYTRTLTESNFVWLRRYWWHFLPLPVSIMLWWLQWPFPTAYGQYLPCLLEASCSLAYMNRLPHIIMTWISLVCYAVLVLRLLTPYEEKIKSSHSAIEDINLRWVKALSWTLLILTTSAIVFELGRHLGLKSMVTGGHLQALALFLVSFLLVRYGMQQMEIQHDESSSQVEPREVSLALKDKHQVLKVKKYQTSSLSVQQAADVWGNLQQLMATEMPYRQPGLKVLDLAKMLDISVNHLSETINGYAQLSFYDFINQHRVNEAARLLLDPRAVHLSVTDIGFQAGFNSNSTFFSHFKKYFGQTPKQYRQENMTKTT
ncbi:MAG: helix-turn-helix domain-containing protein [Alkalimonas sp.]|nr:helix-turn-helix domain-containing protein [Alkalimonas sp.]